jgi:3',5'-cyclic AMP phosphodiesterase CpdA
VRLWVLSDWHMERRITFDPPRPAFDVLVVAGDVSNRLEEAIRMVAALAAGKPAIFVAGNHEWLRIALLALHPPTSSIRSSNSMCKRAAAS